ncbi:MAG: DUF547 domain-containing protein [Vicinamibacterales bacterium]
MKFCSVWLTVVGLLMCPVAGAQTDRHAAFDQLLDLYVRDGDVNYRGLAADRARLDRYVAGLDVPAAERAGWSRPEQEAFWLNAYNALVLETVLTRYPIRGTSTLYPRDSIRQIPGAFERTTHRVGGETLTLDAIESKLIDDFGDARLVLALGRGARGSGRLRSEAYRGATLEAQVQQALQECAQRAVCASLDRTTRTLTVTPLIGWRSEAFERSFAPAAGSRWMSRSPIERAVAAMLSPVLFESERSVLALDTFQLKYAEFDWSLNEL